jgi:hypothetical protein
VSCRAIWSIGHCVGELIPDTTAQSGRMQCDVRRISVACYGAVAFARLMASQLNGVKSVSGSVARVRVEVEEALSLRRIAGLYRVLQLLWSHSIPLL